jgi:hypothetical protein
MRPLQASGGYLDGLLNGNVFEALSGPFVDTLGVPMAALLFFGGIGAAYYANSGKALMPVVMIILVGGVTLAYAPAAAARFAVITLLLGLASVAYLAWQQASGGP